MKKLLLITFLILIPNLNVLAAGGSSGGSGGSGGDGIEKKSMYKSAVNYVKSGKKLEKKGKVEKAKKKI